MNQTLYVQRPVENREEILSWAKENGIDVVDDLHVTLIYSEREFDVSQLSPDSNLLTIENDSRKLEFFGKEKNVLVLTIESEELASRHDAIIAAGASTDFPIYKPHITISQEPDFNISEIEPFRRAIKLGAEEFSTIEKTKLTKTTFEATTDICKVDEALGLVLGWAMISKIYGEDYWDTQDQHIPEEEVLKSATKFMLNSRVSKEMHKGDSIGTVVFAFPLTTEIAKSMGIESKITGLMIAIKPDDKEVLEKFRSGEYTGFSIGGKARTEEVDA
jgi:hypothetical protein